MEIAPKLSASFYYITSSVNERQGLIIKVEPTNKANKLGAGVASVTLKGFRLVFYYKILSRYKSRCIRRSTGKTLCRIKVLKLLRRFIHEIHTSTFPRLPHAYNLFDEREGWGWKHPKCISDDGRLGKQV